MPIRIGAEKPHSRLVGAQQAVCAPRVEQKEHSERMGRRYLAACPRP